MHMQLNEQFIVDERGSKQAVIIPFANYLRIIDIIRRYDEPWQTHKGSPQEVKAWLAADTDQHYPLGNPKHIDRTIQEIRNAWGDTRDHGCTDFWTNDDRLNTAASDLAVNVLD